MIIWGTNPQGFKTNSDVFVAGDGYMYFQGTDQAVWRVNAADASDSNNFGGSGVIKTRSNVFVAGNSMFFRGTDNTVWQMNTDGSGLHNPGGFKTNSDIFVAADGYMYFQGTDQAIWRVNVADPSERNNFGGPGVIKTQSNVFVAGNSMFFRGTDNTVWQMNTDGSGLHNPGGFKTNSDIFVAADGYMYFQGTDQAIWRVNVADPSKRNNFGGAGVIKTQSNVFASGNSMFFRGTDNTVWQMNTDGSGLHNPGGFKTNSDVFVIGNIMYFQGTDHSVWQVNLNDGPMQPYAHAAAEALQGWYNGTHEDALGHGAGQWSSTGWWNAANALNALIDYMSITTNRGYLSVIATTFKECGGGNFLNSYYDDEGWWALTWINAYDLTGNLTYLKMAETIFQDMTLGWDDVSGGLFWQKDHTDGKGHKPYKNAIPNELFLAVAIRLYIRTTTVEYLNWAKREWKWFQASGLINSDGLINDSLNITTGRNDGTTPVFTYNQGVILGGLVDLGIVTKDISNTNAALSIANAVFHPGNNLVNAGGILTERGDQNKTGPDLPNFKGVFIRNLGYLCKNFTFPSGVSFIQKNAQSMLQNSRSFINQFGYSWSGPFGSPDAARQTSALDALNAAMRILGLADPS